MARPARRPPDFVRNGWSIRFHPLFRERFEALIIEVEELERADPQNFQGHPSAKLLAALMHAIDTLVPADPNAAQFRLGNTMGAANSNWRRVKGNGLPQRYRLFFRFMTSAKTIVFAWLNSEGTLRKDGDKNDVYAVFKKMLANGKVPNDFDELLKKASE